MKAILRISVISLIIVYSTMATQYLNDDSERKALREKANTTLTDLYEMEPDAKQVVEGAVGYAVFSSFGMKILLAGGGSGQGVAFNNKNDSQTFMKMVEVQAGLGFGIKKIQLVWVFETQEGFDSFVNSGWEFGAQATAAATADDMGGSIQGAVSVSPGVWLYQMTEDGLALELTVKGTKYYKDDSLNNS